MTHPWTQPRCAYIPEMRGCDHDCQPGPGNIQKCMDGMTSWKRPKQTRYTFRGKALCAEMPRERLPAQHAEKGSLCSEILFEDDYRWCTVTSTQDLLQVLKIILCMKAELNQCRNTRLQSKSLVSVSLHASYIPTARGMVCDANLTRQCPLACSFKTLRW